MATNDTEGFSPLDSLGPEFGRISAPNLNPISLQAFEGDRLSAPKIDFPAPSIPGFDSTNKNTLDIQRTIVGNSPNRPGPKKGMSSADLDENLYNYGKSLLQANQDKNQYAKIYSYNAGASGNAFYKRYAAYGQEKFDEVGFSPLRDNESLFNERTNGWNDFSRMMQHSFVPLFKQGFIAGPKSLWKAMQGDFSGDTEDARVYEEAAAIGQSSKGGLFGFANNTLMNFGYSAGIMTEAVAEMAGEALITGLSGGAGGGLLATRTAANMSKVGKSFSKMFYVDKASDLFRTSLESVANTQAARGFWKAANSKVGKFFNPLTNTFEAASDVYKITKFDNISGLAALSKTAGGFYRDIKGINMAFSEARLEGGMVQNSIYDKLYENYWNEHGEAPDNEMMYEMTKQAKLASVETMSWNTALIFASNKIEFPNIVNPKGGIAKFLNKTTQDILNVDSKVGKVIFDSSKEEFQFIKNSFKQSLKDIKANPIGGSLKFGAKYFKANITEGLQENAQEIIAGTMEKYYTDTFKDPAVASHMYAKGTTAKAVRDKYSYFNDEVGEQNPFTARGFETFASGFAMGMFAAPLNSAVEWGSYGYNKMFDKENFDQYVKAKEGYGKSVAAELTALYRDPKKFFDSKIFNYAAQNKISSIRARGNKKESLDVSDEALVRGVNTAISTGTFDMFKEHIASFRDLSDEEFEDAMKIEKGEASKYRGRIDEVLKRADSIQTEHKKMNERFPDPIDLGNYEKGTDAYTKAAIFLSTWQAARDNAVFMNESFNNARQRVKDIENTIRSERPLSKMTDSEINVLSNPGRIKNEIELLKSELESSRENLSATEISQRQKKIDALSEFKKAYDYYGKYELIDREGQIEKAKAKGLFKNLKDEAGNDISEADAESMMRQELNRTLNTRERTPENTDKANADLELAYKNYLKAVAGLNDDYYLEESADSAYEMLLDSYKLGREASTLATHVNLLRNPKDFTSLVDRNFKWMTDLYNNRQSYYEDMINQEMSNIEINALLNELANKNIYISADDALEFQRTGALPEEFFDNSRKVVIKEGHPQYEDYAFLFERANRLRIIGRTDKGINNDSLVRELAKLQVEENTEISTLPTQEMRTSKGELDMMDEPFISVEAVMDQLGDGEYVDVTYAGKLVKKKVTLYRDGNVLKFNDKDGEEVPMEDNKDKFKKGTKYLKELKPDPIAAAKIKKEYAVKREELIKLTTQKLKEEKPSAEDEFVPFTTSSKLDSMDPELQQALQTSFNEYVNDNEKLIEVYQELDDVAYKEVLADFVKNNKIAKKVIEDYNQAVLDKLVTEKELEVAPPVVMINGKEVDLDGLTEKQVQAKIRTLQRKVDTLKKTDEEEMTEDQRETLAMIEFNLELASKYLRNLQEVKVLEETEVKEPTDAEKVKRYRAEEKVEVAKVIPNIAEYTVDGEIDRNLMPDDIKAKYVKIYDKYDKLISPLLPKTKKDTNPAIDDIERRREEELDKAGLSESKLENVAFVNQKELTQRNEINAKYDAELAALEQPSMQVATEINPELKSQLNTMGYTNTAIKNLPKSILERIVREAIPYEEFKTRVITDSLVTKESPWASEGTPVVIKSTTKDGVKLQHVNGEEPIFVTFEEFETRTSEKQKLSNMEPTTTVTELTPETQEIISKGKDAASNFTDAQIDALEKDTAKEKLDKLEEDLFNSNPC